MSRPGVIVSRVFGRKIEGDVALPVYNASPGQRLPVVLDSSPRVIVPALWGFTGTHGRMAGRMVINARSESVAERPMFRDAFRHRRCLVIADGFYEWLKSDAGKLPYRITLEGGELFAFAGIWSEESGAPTYVVLTTAANSVTRPIHDRMPVILEESEQDPWLDHSLSIDATLDLLDPYPEGRMRAYRVSRAVNSSRNDRPELIEPLANDGGDGPVTRGPAQMRLSDVLPEGEPVADVDGAVADVDGAEGEEE